MAKKFGGQIYCWSPNLKVGGTVSPSPYGCCTYEVHWILSALENQLRAGLV